MVTGKITIGPEINPIAETSTKIIIEEEETTIIEVVIETTDPIIEIILGSKIETTTEMVVGTIIDQIIEGMTVTRDMLIEIRIMVGLEKGIEEGVDQEKVHNPGVAVDLKAETGIGDRVETTLGIGTGLNQGPDYLLM